MNNLSSYFGLVDAKIRASDKDLPVLQIFDNATVIPELRKNLQISTKSRPLNP